MKFTKENRIGLSALEHFISNAEIAGIGIRQCSNGVIQYFAVGSTYHAGRFKIELRSDEFEGSVLVALGKAIQAHEDKAVDNV